LLINRGRFWDGATPSSNGLYGRKAVIARLKSDRTQRTLHIPFDLRRKLSIGVSTESQPWVVAAPNA
jgi:hypothetical protein